MSILSDRYYAEKISGGKYRYDITASTGEYDFFESLLINKRNFNIGGHSFNCGPRPDRWSGVKTDLAITKGRDNVTSVKRPNPELYAGYGDLNGLDGCIILYNPDFKEVGITTIEIFIARGYRNDTGCLFELFQDGELDHEISELREISENISINSNKKTNHAKRSDRQTN